MRILKSPSLTTTNPVKATKKPYTNKKIVSLTHQWRQEPSTCRRSIPTSIKYLQIIATASAEPSASGLSDGTAAVVTAAAIDIAATDGNGDVYCGITEASTAVEATAGNSGPLLTKLQSSTPSSPYKAWSRLEISLSHPER